MKKASVLIPIVLSICAVFVGASLLTDYSFENCPPGTITSDLGGNFVSWGTGDALEIVEAENGITLLHGAQRVQASISKL